MIVDYDKLRADGYEVVQLEENIHIVKNFISKEDGEFLLNITETISEEAWHEEFLYNLKTQCREQFGSDDLEQLERDGLIVLDKQYQYDKSIALAYSLREENPMSTVSDESYRICLSLTERLADVVALGYRLFPFNSMRRHYPGDGMVDHTDQKDTPDQRQSCVLYLNDDYSGGELYFTDQKIDVKPEQFSLAIFNNGVDYMHGVRTVLPGKTRYTLATFISKVV